MTKGWISLDQKVRDHWLFGEKRIFSRFEAWVDMLLSANHAGGKFIIDGQLEVIERGSFITSIRKLSERWQWSNSKIKRFFSLLEKENMLVVKSDTKKMLLKIINYDVYQSGRNKNQQSKDTTASLSHQSRNAKALRKHNTNSQTTITNNDNHIYDSTTSISIYKSIEKEFGRKLSPLECKMIVVWQRQKEYTDELILLALQEAVLNQVCHLKYMDKILFSWERKHLKTVEMFQDALKKWQDKAFMTAETNDSLPYVPLNNWLIDHS